jgi:ribosomal protein S19E (S16A)
MDENIFIQLFIDEVALGNIPSKEILEKVAEHLKNKAPVKPGPKPYLDKSMEKIKNDWEMVFFFRRLKEKVSWDQAKEETAAKFGVSESTVQRKERKLRPDIEIMEDVMHKMQLMKETLQTSESNELTNLGQEMLAKFENMIDKNPMYFKSMNSGED